MNNNPREVLDNDEVFEALQDAEAFGKADSDGVRWNGPVGEVSFTVRATFWWGEGYFVPGEYLLTLRNGHVIAWTGPEF